MQFIFPKPVEWNAFEDIVCDVFARKYQNLNLQRYGRSGQRQHGVDIAGYTVRGLLGVQCKHRPRADIQTAEIDDEVQESASFSPGLAEYVIATSADRDVKSHSHVLDIARLRESAGTYIVSIKYWDDICNWLAEYPDLVYKHFTRFYPHHELEHRYQSSFPDAKKQSISWPCTRDEVVSHIEVSLGGLLKSDPYMLSLGVTTFESNVFAGKTDIDVPLSQLIAAHVEPETSFSEATEILKSIKASITDPYFAKRLILHVQARLAYAFLLGWVFGKVTGFNLLVFSGDEVWSSDGLVPTPTMLADDYPVMGDETCDDIALVLNISRDIRAAVDGYVKTWDRQPKAVVSYRLEGSTVVSAAHALSLAHEISRKIKNLNDVWGARKIHLFCALPSALAVLIGHHLNAICPISIYFFDHSLGSYRLGGTISNS